MSKKARTEKQENIKQHKESLKVNLDNQIKPNKDANLDLCQASKR